MEGHEPVHEEEADVVGSDITVVVTTFPERYDVLGRAVASAANQTLPPEFIIVSVDGEREGAAATRTRGLSQVTTEWTAFLDDDDFLYPEHLEKLKVHADLTDADMVFPWFDVLGTGKDPFPMNEHKEWTLEDPHQTTITMLVRTEAARGVGGFLGDEEDIDGQEVDAEGNRAGEDFRFVLRLAKAGARIEKLHERTWVWVHHTSNTSGLPSNR